MPSYAGLQGPSESLRKKLIEEELRMRAKQPEHWAKTKYRKYAKLTPAELEKIDQAEKKKRRLHRNRKPKAAAAKRKAKGRKK